MARMLRPLAIEPTGKDSICNLQYGARTRSAKWQPKESVRNEDDVRDVWQSVVYICPSLDEVRNAMMFLT